MAQRRALLIDQDPAFQDLLTRSLAPYAMTVHPVTDGSDGLQHVPTLEPEVIFIAVELPDKMGYSTCNKAKKGVARKIPVVLVTSTVPPTDLAQHRKLKVHADEYIDKRTVTSEELVRKIDGLVNLGPPVGDGDVEELPVEAEDIHFDDEPMAEPPQESEATTIGTAAMVDPGIDAETEAVFAGLVEPQESDDEKGDAGAPTFEAQRTGVRAFQGPDSSAGSSEEEEPAPAGDDGLDLGLDAVAEDAAAPAGATIPANDRYLERVNELESELDRLRTQLDEAKRAATPAAPTQFSREREFLNLREVINRKEKEILEAREEVDAKDRVILTGKEKVRELERRLRDSEEKLLNFEGSLVTANETIVALKADKDKALDREKGLKARIDVSQAQIRKADEEFEGLKKRSAAEIAALNGEVAARKKELEQHKREASDRLARLEASSAASLKQAKDDAAAALAAREKAMGDERDGALAAVRADMAEKLEKARQDASAALSVARNELAQKTAALTQERDQALARADREKKEALAKAEADKAAALAAAEETRTRELQEADQKRLSDLRAAEDRRQSELADAAEAQQRALDELTEQKDGELASLRDERDRELAAAEERRVKETTAAEQRRKDELAAAEEKRMKDLFGADTKRREELAASEQKRKDELAALEDRNLRELGALKRTHDDETAKSDFIRQGLETDLEGTKEKLATTEADLGRTRADLEAREQTLAVTERELADRESRVAAQKADIERLEGENAAFQEQLLKAYQKIKADEAVANKAKKAMAIALTLLDGEPPKALVPPSGNGEVEQR